MWVAIVAFLLAAFTMFFENLQHLIIFDKPIPEGCYGFACVRRWFGGSIFIVKIVISVTMLFFGFTFVICFHRAKKGHKATTSSKINYCVKYMFMVHGTITVTAHITDFAALKAGILIANYIGQYGLVFASTEYFVSTLVYFLLFTRKDKAVVVSVRTTTSGQ
ncbi:hypothetical protein QR680_010081 [Steinernema hermaphroditum]|uniref:Uncharacterized protein n=1 Tax=Steinernema hermaphroditum TaxID=289476 RepID=A0AA39IP09_9BILA|nr:hypothetical protein QR680_010081 [Steinernema hermaphroditum]